MMREKLIPVGKIKHKEKKKSKKRQKAKKSRDRKMWIHLCTNSKQDRTL